VINRTLPPSATVNISYSFAFKATGGAPPLAWSETGALPPGLMFSSGVLSGTPTAAGTFPVTVMVQDSLGRNATPQNFTIAVFTTSPPVISTNPLPPGAAIDAPYNFTFTASGGAPPLTWSETGAVPPGLMFSSGGLLSGTPTVDGSFPISVMVQDSVGRNAAQDFTITVFTPNCQKQGEDCYAGHLCCPGLACVAEGNRNKCEPKSQSSEEVSRFTPACMMESARESHTATLLSNGIVLLIGGDDGAVSLATAELFNPASHTFAPTDDMASARVKHTATLLTNGTVVVIGGRDARANALATAELFDPTSMSFAPTGKMSTPRESHTATLLSNGRILITGGDNGIVTLATAELFDPASGSFTPASSMRTPRGFQTATLLKNGKVFVAGGRDAAGNVLATTEIFDPASGKFMSAGNMSTARESHSATLLEDGEVLITGGDNGTASLATAELFDPSSGSFTVTGAMHAAREFHTATLRNDGTVLVAGGAKFTFGVDGGTRTGFRPESTATAELFDPATRSFIKTGDLVDARAKHTGTLLLDGTVLVTGGVDSTGLARRFAPAVLSTGEVFQ
jgi:hypothetical protein